MNILLCPKAGKGGEIKITSSYLVYNAKKNEDSKAESMRYTYDILYSICMYTYTYTHLVNTSVWSIEIFHFLSKKQIRSYDDQQ